MQSLDNSGSVGPANEVGDVPATASRVIVNTTVTEPTAGSYLTVYPSGVTKPLASNLNFSAGQTVPNLVMVKVGTGGNVQIYNNTDRSTLSSMPSATSGPSEM
jgi:hypothetical protein